VTIFSLVAYLLGALVITTTVLPLWRTTRWWVRVWDFPRFQVAILGIVILFVFPIAEWPLAVSDTLLLLGVALSVLWQLSWVWRYFPGSPREVPIATAPPDESGRIAFLTTNVFQNGRDAGGLLDIIRDADPDLVFAVETDEWWCGQLTEGLHSRYTHKLTYPLSNGYGLAIFSRLELVDPSIRFVVDPAIPSIKTGVRLRSGAVIDLFGVHPQPPAPQQDSTERDVELVRVGIEIKRRNRPAVLLGDLNDVAWSPTTSEFKTAGALLDPRRGRGFFNTYPAGIPGFRYPLDYIFHTSHFSVCDMRVLPRYQSDHLPLIATLLLNPDESASIRSIQRESSEDVPVNRVH
jgi:endonuclease/exonuclease/phosphatase (EEP) superfamily protein YafD